jgi:UDP-N-acetyl-D-glucosamine dehydrogenase
VVQRTSLALNDRGKCVKGSKILILGVAYKRDVDDPRESPAFVIMEQLIAQGAEVSYSDPFFPSLPPMRAHQLPAMVSVPLTPVNLASQDAVLIVTDHSAVDYGEIVRHAPLVIDTRNATRHIVEGRERIISA